MLVLSRKQNEAIIVNGDITVTVLSTGKTGKKVRLGITAPREIPVHRQEVFERIHGTAVESAAATKKALVLAAR